MNNKCKYKHNSLIKNISKGQITTLKNRKGIYKEIKLAGTILNKATKRMVITTQAEEGISKVGITPKETISSQQIIQEIIQLVPNKQLLTMPTLL